MTAMDADLAPLVWGLRLVLVLVLVAVLGLVWFIWRGTVRLVLVEVRRARQAGDWWLPWLPQADGTWGPLTDNHWWAAFRARERGGSGALAARWGFWGGIAVVVALGAVAAVVAAVAGLVVVWV